jgi:ATP-dependent RNA helicase RhlE
MTFEDLNLNKQLLNALTDLGITKPTAIQEKVFSTVMSGKDVIGIAQTGTGKTFAYLLPCLRQFQYSKTRVPQIMIIVPTRELVVQVLEEVKKLANYLSLVAVGVYGGVNIKPQIEEVMAGCDLIVGTPGRIVDLLSSGVLKPKSIKKLVIDEFDEMLNLGFRAQLTLIFDRLPDKRQNLLFSATLNDEVEALIHDFFNFPFRIEATPIGTPLENIIQSRFDVNNFYTKSNLLRFLLTEKEEMNKVLVFVSTKHLADLLFDQMIPNFPKQCAVIHSNKAQKHRFEAVNRFHDGSLRFLIATDIIARGLDVEGVSHVVNFDMPEVAENYIHRIGRTGRYDKKGIAISFVGKNESEALKAVEKLMKYKIPKVAFPKEVEISERILPAEMEQIDMKTIQIKLRKAENVGASFHEKSAKNSKVNVRRNHRAEMVAKYGKYIPKSSYK